MLHFLSTLARGLYDPKQADPESLVYRLKTSQGIANLLTPPAMGCQAAQLKTRKSMADTAALVDLTGFTSRRHISPSWYPSLDILLPQRHSPLISTTC